MAVAKSQRISEAFGPQRPTQQGREFRAPRTMMTEAEREQLKLGRDRMIAQTVLDAVSQATKLGLGIGGMVQESNLADRTIAARKEMLQDQIAAEQSKVDPGLAARRRIQQERQQMIGQAGVDSPMDESPADRELEQAVLSDLSGAQEPATPATSRPIVDERVLRSMRSVNKSKGRLKGFYNKQLKTIDSLVKAGALEVGKNEGHFNSFRNSKGAANRRLAATSYVSSPEELRQLEGQLKRTNNKKIIAQVADVIEPIARGVVAADPELALEVRRINEKARAGETLSPQEIETVNQGAIAAAALESNVEQDLRPSEFGDLEPGMAYDETLKQLQSTVRYYKNERLKAAAAGQDVSEFDRYIDFLTSPAVVVRTSDMVSRLEAKKLQSRDLQDVIELAREYVNEGPKRDFKPEKLPAPRKGRASTSGDGSGDGSTEQTPTREPNILRGAYRIVYGKPMGRKDERTVRTRGDQALDDISGSVANGKKHKSFQKLMSKFPDFVAKNPRYKELTPPKLVSAAKAYMKPGQAKSSADTFNPVAVRENVQRALKDAGIPSADTLGLKLVGEDGKLVDDYVTQVDKALKGLTNKALYKAATGKKSDAESLVGMARKNPKPFGLTMKGRKFYQKNENGKEVEVNLRAMDTGILEKRLLGKARSRLLDSIQTIARRRTTQN